MNERREARWTTKQQVKLEKRHKDIRREYEYREAKIRKKRDASEKELYARLHDELEPAEEAAEGYAKEKLAGDIAKVYMTLQNMPEDRELEIHEMHLQATLDKAEHEIVGQGYEPCRKQNVQDTLNMADREWILG